jgi:hypothetical protein
VSLPCPGKASVSKDWVASFQDIIKDFLFTREGLRSGAPGQATLTARRAADAECCRASRRFGDAHARFPTKRQANEGAAWMSTVGKRRLLRQRPANCADAYAEKQPFNADCPQSISDYSLSR